MSDANGGISHENRAVSVRFFDRVSTALLTVQIVTLVTAIALRPSLSVRLAAIAIVAMCLFAIVARWKRTISAHEAEASNRAYLTLLPVILAAASASLIMPSRGVLTTLGWIFIPLVMTSGMLLIGWGVRFRRHTGLFCGRCRYSVEAEPRPARCPECGAALDRVTSTVKEYHERQVWLIVAGVLVIVLGVGSMFTTMFSPTRLSVYRLVPDAMIARMATGEPDNLSLWQNIEARTLDPAVRSSIIDGLLNNRTGRTRSTDHSERWLTMQVAAGSLSPEQLSGFLHTYSTLELRQEDSRDSIGASEQRIVLDGVSRGSWFPPVTVYAHVVQAEIDGAAVVFAPSSLNLFDITPGIRSIKARREGPIRLPFTSLSQDIGSGKLRVRVLLVAAGFGDAAETPKFAADGALIPTPSHIASEWVDLEVRIESD